MSVTKSPLTPMLRKLEYWTVLSDEDRNALLALPHQLRTIQRHGYIVRVGSKPTRSCLLLSGFAYRQKVVVEGARQIMSVHMAGDLVDLQNSLLGTADHSVQALTHCEVAYIPREAVKAIAFQRPAIGFAMWYDTLVDGSIFREWIANIGRRDAKTRLAHLLCEFAVRLEAAGLGTLNAWDLPMTQEELGDATGLTSVHVNRTLMALIEEGLVSRNRKSVTVNDWKGLAETGDFQSAYLHMPQDKLGLAE